MLGATSLALASIALIVDAKYYAGMGHDPILAALGVIIDVIAIISPTVIRQVPGIGTRIIGWFIWSGAVSLTLLATSGWSSQNIGVKPALSMPYAPRSCLTGLPVTSP